MKPAQRCKRPLSEHRRWRRRTSQWGTSCVCPIMRSCRVTWYFWARRTPTASVTSRQPTWTERPTSRYRTRRQPSLCRYNCVPTAMPSFPQFMSRAVCDFPRFVNFYFLYVTWNLFIEKDMQNVRCDMIFFPVAVLKEKRSLQDIDASISLISLPVVIEMYTPMRMKQDTVSTKHAWAGTTAKYPMQHNVITATTLLRRPRRLPLRRENCAHRPNWTPFGPRSTVRTLTRTCTSSWAPWASSQRVVVWGSEYLWVRNRCCCAAHDWRTPTPPMVGTPKEAETRILLIA